MKRHFCGRNRVKERTKCESVGSNNCWNSSRPRPCSHTFDPTLRMCYSQYSKILNKPWPIWGVHYVDSLSARPSSTAPTDRCRSDTMPTVCGRYPSPLLTAILKYSNHVITPITAWRRGYLPFPHHQHSALCRYGSRWEDYCYCRLPFVIL